MKLIKKLFETCTCETKRKEASEEKNMESKFYR